MDTSWKEKIQTNVQYEYFQVDLIQLQRVIHNTRNKGKFLQLFWIFDRLNPEIMAKLLYCLVRLFLMQLYANFSNMPTKLTFFKRSKTKATLTKQGQTIR